MNEKMEALFKNIPNLNLGDMKNLPLHNFADTVNTYVCNELIPEKRFDEAKHYLENCIQIVPSYSFLYLSMAEISLLQRQEEEAFKWLNKAIQVQPDVTYEIDTLECFACLRSHPRYMDLFHCKLQPQSLKSFYFLEIFYQIQGTGLQLFIITDKAATVEKIIQDELKTCDGFYTLLKYEKYIKVHCYINGIRTGELDLRPFLNIRIPNKLTASFTSNCKPIIKDWTGNPISPEALYDLLYGYNWEEEQEETVLFGAWEEKLGRLHGEVISDKEPLQITGESSVWKIQAGKLYEIEERKLVPLFPIISDLEN